VKIILAELMPSHPPRVESGDETGPERSRLIAEAIDSQDLPSPPPTLILLPESPGRVHVRWSIEPALVTRGFDLLGIPPESTTFILRIFEFTHPDHGFAEASKWEDFPITGLDNSGYFNLCGTPEFVNGVIGLKNDHGHFRPLLRGQAIALPQPAAPEPPGDDDSLARELDPAAGGKGSGLLDEADILARLPPLDGLPDELQRLPIRVGPLKPPALPDPPDLAAAAIHAAMVAEHPETAVVCEAAVPEPPRLGGGLPGGASELAGASEQLASQCSDGWDERAAFNLRAELVVSGRLAPGIRLTSGGNTVPLLPGRTFQFVRQLHGFTEVWPLFANLPLLTESVSPAVTLAQTTTGGKPFLEMHAAITFEGRVSDPGYRRFLPHEVTLDANGRFKVTCPLPDGAVLLPGISLLAEA